MALTHARYVRRWLARLVMVVGLLYPTIAHGQGAATWDLHLDAQAGVPGGYIQVRESELRGTRLRLRDDLGVDTSEAVSLTGRYHVTDRDAVRATLLYYFLDGTADFDRAKVWDGQLIGPGRVAANFDFWRATLAYERLLFDLGGRTRVTGSVGATYVHLNAKVEKKAEDFYLQELPVPVAGLRLEYRLADRFTVWGSVEGGGLPRVDSLRKEGGTVWLEQHHADAGIGVTYAISPSVFVGAGYQLTYFFQHEHSHEDGNTFQLLDSALRLRVGWRF
jgi:hypothetical protein